MIYRDRVEAGKRLATQLKKYVKRHDLLVLAIRRGGVPVAFEVASALGASLDVFPMSKFGVPDCRALAKGVGAAGGISVLNTPGMNYVRVSEGAGFCAVSEFSELNRRELDFRGDWPAPDVLRKTVILVDDGLATGSFMRDAAVAIRKQGASRIIAAVPVSAPETCDEYLLEVDEVFCTEMQKPFEGTGHWYQNFSQTTDDEAYALLALDIGMFGSAGTLRQQIKSEK